MKIKMFLFFYGDGKKGLNYKYWWKVGSIREAERSLKSFEKKGIKVRSAWFIDTVKKWSVRIRMFFYM